MNTFQDGAKAAVKKVQDFEYGYWGADANPTLHVLALAHVACEANPDGWQQWARFGTTARLYSRTRHSKFISWHDVADLIASKQADYGPENILKFGLDGLVIRTWDKVARLQNLAAKATPKHESVVDTLMDIMGYSLIAVMLLDETFTLPLEGD